MNPRVLHVLGWYFPRHTGGSEIYVQSLVRALASHGFHSEVAVPGQSVSSYEHEGITVHTYVPVAGSAGGTQEERQAELRAWLQDRAPEVVHFHSVTEGVGLAEAEVVQALGIPAVITVHVPEAICMRGSMTRWGREPCDGEMRVHRCAACALQARGLPRVAAQLIGGLSPAVGRFLSPVPGRMGTMLRMPAIVEDRSATVRRLFGICRRVIAVCQWLHDALERNGVPREKLILSRQATDPPREGPPHRIRRADEPVRIGYLGRYNPIKGIETLVRAVRALPVDLPLEIELHGPVNSKAERAYRDHLAGLVAGDRRIVLSGPLPREELATFFARLDMLAVPSVVLETGPLVVLEALAHGIPILGSRLGGIAELVEEGSNGWLLPPGEVPAWADALRQLAREPQRLEALMFSPKSPRGWDEVAAENAAVYQEVLQASAVLR